MHIDGIKNHWKKRKKEKMADFKVNQTISFAKLRAEHTWIQSKTVITHTNSTEVSSKRDMEPH